MTTNAALRVGKVVQFSDVEQKDAEALFSNSDAAIYLPAERKVLIFQDRSEGPDQTSITLSEFMAEIEKRIPIDSEGSPGEYVVKFPGKIPENAHAAGSLSWPGAEASPIPTPVPAPNAVAMSDSFESGNLNSWTLIGDPGNYLPAASACAARTGSYCADMVRGGSSGPALSCSSNYPGSQVIIMYRDANIFGASSATLESYILLATEASYDVIGFGAGDPFNAYTSDYYFYSGSKTTWFRVLLDLKQFGDLGDATRFSSTRFLIGFISDSTIQSGFGARVDDYTIQTGAAQTFNLTVTKQGTGAGTVTSTPAGIACGSACTASFASGQNVTLTASPTAGSTFAGWGGACSGTGACSVTMSQNQSVTATFNPQGGGSCVSGPTTLCIDNNSGDRRFKVEVSFMTSQGGGSSGNGQAISLASVGVSRGGMFTFFSADNPEVLVKVLNGCGLNSRFWIFLTAGTNVGFTATITDTNTGQVRTYTNPDLTHAVPVQDTSALATCP